MADWPHSPPHPLCSPGTYMIPAATYLKHPFFQSRDHLDFLLTLPAPEDRARRSSLGHSPNHYHFVGFSNPAEELHSLLCYFHSVTAAEVNGLDHSPGGRIWFQFWDSHRTYQNLIPLDFGTFTTTPFRHELTRLAQNDPWCSAGWFQRKASHDPQFFMRSTARARRFRCKHRSDWGIVRAAALERESSLSLFSGRLRSVSHGEPPSVRSKRLFRKK